MKRKGAMEDYEISLAISSILELKGDQMIDGYCVWLSLSFAGKWSHIWRGTDGCGEQWNGQDNLLQLYILVFSSCIRNAVPIKVLQGVLELCEILKI